MGEPALTPRMLAEHPQVACLSLLREVLFTARVTLITSHPYLDDDEHTGELEDHVPAAYAMALLHQIAALEGTLHCYRRSLALRPLQGGKEIITKNDRPF